MNVIKVVGFFNETLCYTKIISAVLFVLHFISVCVEMNLISPWGTVLKGSYFNFISFHAFNFQNETQRLSQ